MTRKLYVYKKNHFKITGPTGILGENRDIKTVTREPLPCHFKITINVILPLPTQAIGVSVIIYKVCLERVRKLWNSCLCREWLIDSVVYSVTISWSRCSEPLSRHILYFVIIKYIIFRWKITGDLDFCRVNQELQIMRFVI